MDDHQDNDDGDRLDTAGQQRIDRLVGAPLFPFEGEFRLKPLSDPMAEELPRNGEDGQTCHACKNVEHVVWSSSRWRISTIRPSANPVGLFLETTDHLDFEDFDDQMAAEYGVVSRHLEAAIRNLPAVGRVHIHRWGDGSAHFHVWFQGRPARQLELYGWGNVLWPQVLPPLPKAEIAANHEKVLRTFTDSIEQSAFFA